MHSGITDLIHRRARELGIDDYIADPIQTIQRPGIAPADGPVQCAWEVGLYTTLAYKVPPLATFWVLGLTEGRYRLAQAREEISLGGKYRNGAKAVPARSGVSR